MDNTPNNEEPAAEDDLKDCKVNTTLDQALMLGKIVLLIMCAFGIAGFLSSLQ